MQADVPIKKSEVETKRKEIYGWGGGGGGGGV